MKLLIVRHGDPDYEHNCLTEQGKAEAQLLAERLSKIDVKAFYVSPMGRAQETAFYTLRKMNRTAETLPWLREFDGVKILNPSEPEAPSRCWDRLPGEWMAHPEFFDKDKWKDGPAVCGTPLAEYYQSIVRSLDELIASHGYRRDGFLYRAESPSNDVIVLICHFGLESVLLSHLLNVSPMILWHGTCAAPTSVTTLATEEREQGIASFRMLSYGDTSHLYAAGVEPAFSGRFRECFTNDWERA